MTAVMSKLADLAVSICHMFSVLCLKSHFNKFQTVSFSSKWPAVGYQYPLARDVSF